jgi:hypothetical protein
MAMMFINAREAVKTLLTTAAAGRFVVIGAKRSTSAEEVKGVLRTVQVYYSTGNFPKKSGGNYGVAHDVTLKIELVAAAAAIGNIAPLMASDSTAQEFADALATFQDASTTADNSIDDLADIVYQILMDGRNMDLGLADCEVSNRWISDIVKNEPSPRGEYVVIGATMNLTFRVGETLTGDAGTDADDYGVTTEIETNIPGSDAADPAQSVASGDGG